MYYEDSFLRNIKTQQKNKHKKPRREIVTVTDLLESLFYELKPVLYLVISLTALRSSYGETGVVKFAALGVLVFTAAIIHARLTNRGVIK